MDMITYSNLLKDVVNSPMKHNHISKEMNNNLYRYALIIHSTTKFHSNGNKRLRLYNIQVLQPIFLIFVCAACTCCINIAKTKILLKVKK